MQNTILLQIPDNEFEAIQPHLKFIPLELATCLHRERELIRAVYFMNRGIASMLVETDDGRSVEVGVCGREDMIGLGLAAGLETLACDVFEVGIRGVLGGDFEFRKRLLDLPKR